MYTTLNGKNLHVKLLKTTYIHQHIDGGINSNLTKVVGFFKVERENIISVRKEEGPGTLVTILKVEISKQKKGLIIYPP